MGDNHTNKWSEGLRFIQMMKNQTYHSGIKQSPYEAMFGCPAKIGLTNSRIPKEIIPSIVTEDDLRSIFDELNGGRRNEGQNWDVNEIVDTPDEEVINTAFAEERNDEEGALSILRKNGIILEEDVSSHTHATDVTAEESEIAVVAQESDESEVESDKETDMIYYHQDSFSDEEEVEGEEMDVQQGQLHNGKCFICEEVITGKFYVCKNCGNSTDDDCCFMDIESGGVLCLLCKKKVLIHDARHKSFIGLQKQAVRMKNQSAKQFPPVVPGGNVVIKVPDVD